MNVFEYIVNRSNDFITVIDRGYVYTLANDAYCRQMERPRDQIIGRTVGQVWGEERFQSVIKGYLDRCFRGEEVDTISKFKFGPFEKYMHVTYFPYSDSGEVSHALVFSHDITRIGEIESKLTDYEYRDPVTGLFNRRSLKIVLEKEIEKAKASSADKMRAVVCVGLQSFDDIVRLHGYEIGDLLLENTGLRFRRSLKAGDYVFRFDGRELAAVITHITDRNELASMAHTVYNEIAIPYRYHEHDISITCAIGISLYPDDGENADTILANALTTMAGARERKEPFLIFDQALNTKARGRLAMQGELHKAFHEGQFVLHYQPIVDPRGRVVGAESLIRWRHPTRGLVLPGDFLDVAAQSGLMGTIGRWVMFNACRQASVWTRNHDMFVTMNLSANEFDDDKLPDTLSSALAQAGNLEPSRIRLEITETECMLDPKATIDRMRELQAMGVEILIDDFGIGQSSLGYLKSLPALGLKIDKSFLEDVEERREEQQFLRALVGIVKSRQKLVLMEGISTPGQAWLSNALYCDLMQGYLFGKPVPPEQFEKILAAPPSFPTATLKT